MVTVRAALAAAAVGVLAVAAPAAAAPGGRGAPSGQDSEVWTTLNAAQVEALITESGAVVTDRLEGSEGGFNLNFQYANGYHAYIEGFDCAGTGPAISCAEFELGAVYTADSAEHALQLERQLDFVWVADLADVENTELLVWRRDCLHGGVTRGQIRHTLEMMEDQLALIGQAIWPEDGTVRDQGTVET